MKENVKTNRKAIQVKDIEHDSKAGKHRKGFDRLLADSVDETVTEVVGAKVSGEKVSSILWRYWEGNLGVTYENLHDNLPKVFEWIETIFGTRGETVGQLVIKRLYTKANVPLEYSQNQPLEEYAEKLKQILEKDSEQP
jgi:hypothetical protein